MADNRNQFILPALGLALATAAVSIGGTLVLLRRSSGLGAPPPTKEKTTAQTEVEDFTRLAPNPTPSVSSVVDSDQKLQTKNPAPKAPPVKKTPTDPLIAPPINGDPPQPVYKFVMTGGPCAGKTTGLSKLSESLRNFGFSVYTVPEAATILFSNGIPFSDLTSEYNTFAFQWTLLSLQISLEEGFERLARATNRPSVLICDRGLMDGAAYIDPFWWHRILQGKGLSNVEVREGRYDAVFHLVTAAQGAEKYYTTANNEARQETPEEARQQDTKTQLCWLGHPHHHIFDNSTDFKGKMQRLLDCAAKMVGMPFGKLSGVTKKYLLREVPSMENFPSAFQEFEVTKTYLRAIETKHFEGKSSDNLQALAGEEAAGVGETPSKLYRNFTKAKDKAPVDYSFVRRRKQGGLSVYQLTIVKTAPNGKRIEMKRMITKREYKSLVALDADPNRNVLRQKRYSFLWQTQSFQIHVFTHPIDHVAVLHCQAETEDIELPPFLQIFSEPLEDEGQYSGWQVSLKDYSPEEGPLSPRPSELQLSKNRSSMF